MGGGPTPGGDLSFREALRFSDFPSIDNKSLLLPGFNIGLYLRAESPPAPRHISSEGTRSAYVCQIPTPASKSLVSYR